MQNVLLFAASHATSYGGQCIRLRVFGFKLRTVDVMAVTDEFITMF